MVWECVEASVTIVAASVPFLRVFILESSTKNGYQSTGPIRDIKPVEEALASSDRSTS
jgi:hypothetical protein